MTITPISGLAPARTNRVSFSSKNKSSEQLIPSELTQSHSSLNGLRKVPVIVMLAMSPITIPNAQASSISDPEPEPVESSQYYGGYSKREPELIGDFETVSGRLRGHNYTCYFGKFDTDGKKNTCEILTFVYQHDLPNSKATGCIYGAVKKISSKPVNEKGEYAMVFDQNCKNNQVKTFVCLVPEEIAKKIRSINFSNMGIGMCLSSHIDNISNEFGKYKGYLSDYVNIKKINNNESFMY